MKFLSTIPFQAFLYDIQWFSKSPPLFYNRLHNISKLVVQF